MKYLFASMFVLLTVLFLATEWSLPEKASEHPLLYWVTDPNPAREEQVALFEDWLRENGYPEVDLRIDSANENVSKKLIQGVSGVLSDLADLNGNNHVGFFVDIGLLKDVTDEAQAHGFELEKTWPALQSILTVDGRQYGYPANMTISMNWVNREAFEEVGMEVPPERWDFKTFERIGKAFVKRANEGKEYQDVFFVNLLDRYSMRRSLGLSVMNETATWCILGDDRNRQVFELIAKWTYEDHLLPTAAEASSFSVSSGYKGRDLQMFAQKNYGMIFSGRYAIIQFREFEGLEFSISETPNGGFPNARVNGRVVTIYEGSDNPELAAYFLEYLASETYNMQVVRDGDALPPNPVYTETEAFIRPPDHPNEWGVHEAFAQAARNIAVGYSGSPFVLASFVHWVEKDAFEAYIAGVYSAADAGQLAEDRINKRIRASLRRSGKLAKEHARRLRIQERIEERLAEGRPVPENWIFNPFHLAYYGATGRLAEPEPLP